MECLSGKNIILGGLVALASVFYQYVIKDALFVTYGVGRHVQKVSEFPYQCRKIQNRQVEACGDMWLDETSRTLYLACSDIMSRARRVGSTNDQIIAMSIDRPTSEGSYEYTVVKASENTNADGPTRFPLSGMTNRLTFVDTELYLVNTQPSFHSNGIFKPQHSSGINPTIEVFTLSHGSSSLTHARTISHPQIVSPSNIALMPDGSMYITNSHGLNRAGWRHQLSPIIRSGNIARCTASNPPLCKSVAHDLSWPSGLIYSASQDRLFVPSATMGDIHVYQPLDDGGLDFIETIKIPYPIESLSEDSDGNIIAAVIPKLRETQAKARHRKTDHHYPPEVARQMYLKKTRKQPAAAAVKIRRVSSGRKVKWEVEKLIEDSAGEVLPASTSVVRDGKTGRLFLSGTFSEWITVCEPIEQ